jgi:membrane protease YdiL (CAAX protease family)
MPHLLLEKTPDGPQRIAALVIQNLIFIAIAVWACRRQRVTLAQIGLGLPTFRQAAFGLGMGVAVFVVAYAAGALCERLLQMLLAPNAYHALIDENRRLSAESGFIAMGNSLWLRAAFVFTGAVIAPIGEEMVFRGLIFRALRTRNSIRVAIFGSSLVFALVHISPLTICVIFLIGLMLAYAYEATGSLWVPILMHGVNNALMFALLWQHPN